MSQALPTRAVKSYFPNLAAATRPAALARPSPASLWCSCVIAALKGSLDAAVGLFAFLACLCYVIGVRVRADRATVPRRLRDRIPLPVCRATSPRPDNSSASIVLVST